MKAFLSTMSVLLIVTAGGCYVNRTSAQICDCTFRNPEFGSEWSLLETPPQQYQSPNWWREYFDKFERMDELLNAFEGAGVHWYQNPAGEITACVVFPNSDHIGAMVSFSSEGSPKESRIIGPPFGSERQAWEKC